ncbi:hypothetical protein BC936DRAFT_142955 [Jimgerdemannia flammicorona]|uniref:BTB domain-containing protein n=1 Tax=Jimgerdemannia flammicorona TaxID=994334 RepID=A0A433DEI3_9FUNG|nr:hypothetical protein BC936DRAFT_142955 [Jimgerdemannia flammicorona]
MVQRSQTHYYEDGNVILCAGDVRFRVHASILRLSSRFFERLFAGNWRETNVQSTSGETTHNNNNNAKTKSRDDNDGVIGGPRIIARVNLVNKDASHVEALLSTLYLHTDTKINWGNVQPILQLADEYIFPRILARCDAFLSRELKKKPLEALILADRYHLADVYKSSMALVIADHASLSHRPEYYQLSPGRRSELLKAVKNREQFRVKHARSVKQTTKWSQPHWVY